MDRRKVQGRKKDGKWVYYYEDGQIKKEGNFNKDRGLDGKWFTYYES
ncbi:MAG: hypothetical protein VX255_21195, partial [Candidatus Latescibacterota bacterium]|nr:hypothetical protein [Candidatus Latescibacterota bacterium]